MGERRESEKRREITSKGDIRIKRKKKCIDRISREEEIEEEIGD